MKELSSEPFVKDLVFPEGPRWHDGRLWLSDMHGGRVLALDPRGGVEEIARVPTRPSGLGFLPDGRLLVVSMQDRRILRLDPEGLVPAADLSGLVGGHPNDMLVDERGNAYVGNFGADFERGEPPRAARLVLVTPDGAAEPVGEPLEFPNGTALLPDGGPLVVAESMGARLTAFDRRPDGALADRRVYAELPGRLPDGIAGDAESAIWVACFTTFEFVRVRPGGEITHRIALEGRRAVACALGGEDRRTLFLLTAETSEEQLARGESRGFVERTRVEVPGAGLP